MMGSIHDFRIVPAGDSAIVVELEERIDPVVNARAIRLADQVHAAAIPGVRDVVPTYRSVAVFFDPIRTDYQRLVAWLEREAEQPGSAQVEERTPISVPVCYGGELGPDLAAVAAFASMSPDEVVAAHASAVYRVFMLGFVPGFAYMGVLDVRIAMPRRATPRVRVPCGAVGIAGAQTGIYPAETPGGWQLIGRTPVKPFDAARPAPFLFKPGDAVRFVPIARAEYEQLLQGV
jgi:KipI family sensor histidine kinase inhibitor